MQVYWYKNHSLIVNTLVKATIITFTTKHKLQNEKNYNSCDALVIKISSAIEAKVSEL